MIIKILAATTAMMIAITADCSTNENTKHVFTLQELERHASIPDNEQIITDLIGHQMYVSEGLPGVWEFSTPADIQHGNIGSSRLNGDSMEFNFTLFLVDNKSQARNTYRAETLVTYKKTNESWKLVTIQDISFKATGTFNSIVPGNFGTDC